MRNVLFGTSIRVHEDGTCLVIECHTCTFDTGRLVSLNLPLGRSREAFDAVEQHWQDEHTVTDPRAAYRVTGA